MRRKRRRSGRIGENWGEEYSRKNGRNWGGRGGEDQEE